MAIYQNRNCGTVSVSWILYRKSAPEQRELFNKFTFYIKDNLVLRLESSNDSTLTENYVEESLQLQVRRITPTYMIDLNSDSVYLFRNNEFKVEKVGVLDTFVSDILFKVKKPMLHEVVSQVDTSSNAIYRVVENLNCLYGKAMVKGLPS